MPGLGTYTFEPTRPQLIATAGGHEYHHESTRDCAMTARLYPSPPHIDLAFCFLGTNARRGISTTCDALTNWLAVATGEQDMLISAKEPTFSSMTDLELRQADATGGADRRQQIDSWLIRAGYRDQTLGLLVAQYGDTRIPQPLRLHPVCVTVSGEYLELDEEALTGEITPSTPTGDRLRSLFRAVCESGSVLYGAILFERQLPSPVELLNPSAELSPELFISNVVRDACQANEKLEKLLAGFSAEQWKGGKYWSGLYAFNAQRLTVPVDSHTSKQVAGIVGRTLQSIV